MLYYESMYIVHPALEAGRLKDLIMSIEKSLHSLGGETCAINVWGKKKLAYPINKEKYGMYVLFQFKNNGVKNKEFNLGLEHNSNVLAYLTTKIEDNTILSDLPSLDSQLGLLNPNANESKPNKEVVEEKTSEAKENSEEKVSSEAPEVAAEEKNQKEAEKVSDTKEEK
jgi:small subunit ribosomal protein S6